MCGDGEAPEALGTVCAALCEASGSSIYRKGTMMYTHADTHRSHDLTDRTERDERARHANATQNHTRKKQLSRFFWGQKSGSSQAISR